MLRVDEDIRPLSKFRDDVAVLADAHAYENMRARLELFEELYQAEEQIALGQGVAHKDAKARVLSRFFQ